MTNSMINMRAKIDAILLNEDAPGVMAGAAAKLNHLITELHPLINHLPSYETIERHLLSLVANNAVVNPNPGQSDKDWQKARRAGDQRAEQAANARSKKALDIIRGYIRCRQALDAAGVDVLKAHEQSIAALKRQPKLDKDYIKAIFHVHES